MWGIFEPESWRMVAQQALHVRQGWENQFHLMPARNSEKANQDCKNEGLQIGALACSGYWSKAKPPAKFLCVLMVRIGQMCSAAGKQTSQGWNMLKSRAKLLHCLLLLWCFHALLWNVPNRHRPASRAGQWQWFWHKWLPARLQGDEGSLHSHSLLHTDHTVPFRTTPHPASHPLLQGDPDRDHQKIDTLA